ncbi:MULTISPECIES: AraC family transcriptional regulator [Sphingobacterium]|uniref:AraC family transcriptional regulator n=1 Tax=Sphingobacterium TaxID=28453 RepID=UPI00257C4BC4|nr:MULTISPECIES: helix-turn-helix domain-containing protein [Sphingobacterium]
MKRPYNLTFSEDFSLINHPRKKVSFSIRNAKEMHWQSARNQISEQTFDGRYAYLYYYEYWISEPMNLTVEIIMHDLHLIYPLLNEVLISGKRMDQEFTFELSPAEGAYFYLAPGQYQLHLPVGRHILVGFVVDAGMFRPPAIQHFPFLKNLIQAKKEGSLTTVKSVGFRVGSITIKYLCILFSILNPNTLNNEHILLKHLIFLIDLSRFKLLDAPYSTQPIAKQTRQLLEIMILQNGAQALIKEIAQIFLKAPAQLSREYQEFHGLSIQDDRNKLLLEHIQQLIVEHDKVGITAHEVGFSGPSEMNRFIKKMTGLTSSQFKQQAEQKFKR